MLFLAPVLAHAQQDCHIEGRTIRDKQSAMLWLNPSGECWGQVRSCENGVLSGIDRYRFSTCVRETAKPAPAPPVPPPQERRACHIENVAIPDGKSANFYASATVSYPESCGNTVARTCRDGFFDGPASHSHAWCNVLNRPTATPQPVQQPQVPLRIQKRTPIEPPLAAPAKPTPPPVIKEEPSWKGVFTDIKTLLTPTSMPEFSEELRMVGLVVLGAVLAIAGVIVFNRRSAPDPSTSPAPAQTFTQEERVQPPVPSRPPPRHAPRSPLPKTTSAKPYVKKSSGPARKTLHRLSNCRSRYYPRPCLGPHAALLSTPRPTSFDGSDS